MIAPKRHLSALRQSAGSARQQQVMNRLQHCEWETSARITALDYALLIAIAVAVVCIGLGVTTWADVPFGGVR